MHTLKTNIGRSQVEFQANDFKGLLEISTLVGQFPAACGLCKSNDIYLFHKAPKGNDYYGLACKECGAEFTFHQKKKGGFYIRYDDTWERYNAGNDVNQQAPADTPPKDEQEFDDDIPF